MPLTTFKGLLKFHNPDVLTPVSSAVMNFCCPGFLIPGKADDEVVLSRAQALADQGVKKIAMIPLEESRSRRWSGDGNVSSLQKTRLSRRSYFGVCMNNEDEDRGGVACELSAYRQPGKSGNVGIFDLNYGSNAETLSTPKSHAFLLNFDAGRFLAWCSPDISRQWHGRPEQGMVFVGLPYLVEHRTIPGVLDLRRKEAQDWMFQTFRKGFGDYWRKPLAEDISSFADMLPKFLAPAIGGSDETQIIAQWLRGQRVNALIYPSARCDAAVVYNGRTEPEVWYGWNLVDYRNSPVPDLNLMEFDASPWSAAMPHYVERQISSDGSWALHGIQKAQDVTYSKRVRIAEEKFRWRQKWFYERCKAVPGDPYARTAEALCTTDWCEWSFKGSTLSDLPDACPECRRSLNKSAEPVYKDFGALLGAAFKMLEQDSRITPAEVREASTRMDYWLDRQCFSEYCGQCLKEGCSEVDAFVIMRMIATALLDHTQFPTYPGGVLE